MKKILAPLALLIIILFNSCELKQKNKASFSDESLHQGLAQTEPPPIDNTSALNESGAASEENRSVVKTEDRKIIKEGEISFETNSVAETKSLITKSVGELNGYISNDDANEYSDRLEHRLTVRVPSDKFDILLNKVSESIKKLDRKNINVLDVTSEYIDIEARIKTKKELQEKYKELLKKASKVEEMIKIEKEIGQLQTEIESVEGQMKYMKDRISYSTLNITYYERTTALFGFSSKFGRAIQSGWDLLLMAIIAITHLWAFILLAIVVLFVATRLMRRNKSKVTSQKS